LATYNATNNAINSNYPDYENRPIVVFRSMGEALSQFQQQNAAAQSQQQQQQSQADNIEVPSLEEQLVVAYEFYSTGVSNIGAIQLPYYADELHSSATIMAGNDVDQWEYWIIKEGGFRIENIILSQDEVGGNPNCYVGVYEKQG